MENMWHRDDTEKYLKTSEILEMCKGMTILQLEKFLLQGQKIARDK